ncbi:hypothetical protein IMY05_012G0030800 [Salix suchowensis]|nr:hypothetical protein IMY05_012G0030800 [Salix suchowensis]
MQIIKHINTKIFTWKIQCGKNYGTVVLKTSTITNNGTTYSWNTARLKRTNLRKGSQY